MSKPLSSSLAEATERLNNNRWRHREEEEKAESEGQDGEREESDEEGRAGRDENANAQEVQAPLPIFRKQRIRNTYRLSTFGITTSNEKSHLEVEEFQSG